MRAKNVIRSLKPEPKHDLNFSEYGPTNRLEDPWTGWLSPGLVQTCGLHLTNRSVRLTNRLVSTLNRLVEPMNRLVGLLIVAACDLPPMNRLVGFSTDWWRIEPVGGAWWTGWWSPGTVAPFPCPMNRLKRPTNRLVKLLDRLVRLMNQPVGSLVSDIVSSIFSPPATRTPPKCTKKCLFNLKFIIHSKNA